MNVETKIKLDRFKPRPYQLPIIDAIENKGYKRVVALLPRRAGKDITAFNLAIRHALRTPCVVYYIFPTYSHAKRVIWDSVTNEGHRLIDYFIPDELVVSKNSQEMKIRFVNGSLLQLVGSDRIDGLVGTNPSLCIFSEYAIQNPKAYQFIRPILVANDGVALFISCVSPETLIITGEGFKRIKNVSHSRQTYSSLNKPIFGLGGFHNAEQFYYGGKQQTLKIKLESGYELECTPVHPVWNGNEWVQSQYLKIGDLIPVQYGQDVWGSGVSFEDFSYNRHGNTKPLDFDITHEDFFYLLGLIHADGNYDKNKICITKKKDPEIIAFLHDNGFKTRLDGIHHELNSREFCALLEYLQFKHGAKLKEFPEALFDCTKKEMQAFLQGLFDGDGCSHSGKNKYGAIKFSSACKEFIDTLQIVLLNFGIVSTTRFEDREPQGRIKVNCRIYNLVITGYFAHIFYRDIGFRLSRKQTNWDNLPASCIDESGNVYPVDASRLVGYSLPKNRVTNPERMTRRLIKKLHNSRPHPYLEELLKENLFYSPIKSIQLGESEVFDFVIPETHSFFSNGFISHNTPRGKNHLYELFQLASSHPSWFAYRLTVEDTNHIPLDVIEQEKQEGLMSEDLIAQEYYCSFSAGVAGSYYSKYLDKMRLESRVGFVPWEPGLKVHTAFDIGVRDSTSIIFFQVAGQTIRIIDFYQKHGEGLEHYVKILQNKDYVYGKHIAPHDIKVKEFGSGITRFEKARQLGIKFTLSNDVSIVDGIEAVRSTLGKMWIDDTRCNTLIKAIENYRQEWDGKRQVYKDKPLHDQYSHAADALRYLCVSLPKTKDDLTPEDLEKRYRRAMYGDQGELPAVFRDEFKYM